MDTLTTEIASRTNTTRKVRASAAYLENIFAVALKDQLMLPVLYCGVYCTNTLHEDKTDV